MMVLVSKLNPLHTRCSIHFDCFSCTVLLHILVVWRSHWALGNVTLLFPNELNVHNIH